MNAQRFLRWAPAIHASLAAHDAPTPLQEVWGLITSGNAQVWPGPDGGGCVVTQITSDPTDATVLTYWILAGELQAIFKMQDGIEAFARSWGCTQARFAPARRGWLRMIRGQGFDEIRPGVMAKAL